jgi:hypothetical protein
MFWVYPEGGVIELPIAAAAAFAAAGVKGCSYCILVLEWSS